MIKLVPTVSNFKAPRVETVLLGGKLNNPDAQSTPDNAEDTNYYDYYNQDDNGINGDDIAAI